MPLLNRKHAALLLALPALLVPVIEIPLVLWARATFLGLHPDFATDPPTISRSINDPIVGEPFANLIVLITALIMIVLPLLMVAYAQTISRFFPKGWRRIAMYSMLVLLFVFQITASTGMVLTTQYTFHVDHHLHMLGSYVFFGFQALTILMAAVLCRLLLRHQQRQGIDDHAWQFPPFMHRFRFRFALLITGLAVLYGVLFVIKDYTLPVDRYLVQIAYTQCEVIVIATFVLFLGSYAIDIHHMIRHDKLRLGGQRVHPKGTGHAGNAASRQ